MNTFDIKITAFAYGGMAFGTLPNGKICFVRGAVPGELVRVKVMSEKTSFAKALLVEILEVSPKRIAPECPLAITSENAGCDCQGCSYQHIPYKMELEWKQKQFEGFMLRSKLADTSAFQPPFPAPSRYNWRNRIKLAHGKSADGSFVLGYKGEDNRSLIPVKECPIARKSINMLIPEATMENIDDSGTHTNFRWTLHDGAFFWNKNTSAPRKYLIEKLAGLGSFQVPCESFFQTNNAVSAELVKRAAAIISDIAPEIILELYCGVGVFSIVAAQMLKNLTVQAVELNKQSIESAKKNASERGLSGRCRFYTDDATGFIRKTAQKIKPEKTLLLLDPPRSGLEGKLVRDITDSRIAHILYVSCAPDTLRRDIEILNRTYEVVSTGIFDMFPSTAHFESMTLLRLK